MSKKSKMAEVPKEAKDESASQRETRIKAEANAAELEKQITHVEARITELKKVGRFNAA